MKKLILSFALALLAQLAHATEPTLVAFAQSTWTDLTNSGAVETTPSITWLTGDVIHILGCTEDNGVTIDTPTATGLTFSLITSIGGASNTQTYYWRATAASGGSGAISANATGSNTRSRGIAVFQFRGTSGQGTPVQLLGSTAKTISVTRGSADSHIILAMGDWAAVGDAAIDPSPGANGTTRIHATGGALATHADFFVLSWSNQGATGTTAYGITNHTGTVDMTGLAVEILGTSGGSKLRIIRRRHP